MPGKEYDWSELIKRGIESDTLDYKAAQNWTKLSKGGKAKFARHCLGMANTKGGYVVVGVGEDASGQPALFTGLTREQAKSFDPTHVGNFINRYADPQIDFSIERPVVDGKQYVVFVIRRFQMMPHVCSSGCDHELLQGIFYIRTADAASRPAYRASEIQALLQRALRNQREILGRMIRGILYEGSHTPPGEQAQSRFAEERSHAMKYFSSRRQNPYEHFFSIELSAAPPEYIGGKYSLSELRRSVNEAFDVYYDSGFITEKEVENAYNTNVSLRSLAESRDKQWQAFQSGLFHFIGLYELRDNSISYLLLVRFIAEAVQFLANFYNDLGYAEEIIPVKLVINKVENVILREDNSKSDDDIFVCRIPEITVRLERSAADLASDPAAHAMQLVKSTCERFNLPDGRHRRLLKLLRSHLARKD
jgi:hypothetical protein